MDAGDMTQDGITLSEDQQSAVRQILEFKDSEFTGALSMILTGRAGSGKTTVVRYLRKLLKGQLAVCATTGRAAVMSGGTTVDRLFCISRTSWRVWSADRLHAIMTQAIPNARVILIDEASMVGSRMAACIYEVAWEYHRKILLVGDWGQASPVKDDLCIKTEPLFYQAKVVKLTECHRQTDRAFMDALDSVRMGSPTPEAVKLFKSRTTGKVKDFPDTAVLLTPTNAQVEKVNGEALNEFVRETGNPIYRCSPVVRGKQDSILQPTPFNLMADDQEQDAFGNRPGDYERILDASPCVETLRVSEGCRCMITYNAPSTGTDEFVYDERDTTPRVNVNLSALRYVNGDTGYVHAIHYINKKGELVPPYDQETDRPMFELGSSMAVSVRLDRTGDIVCLHPARFDLKGPDEKVIASVTGLPLRLGYAFTVHKAQGMTIPKVLFDLPKLKYFKGNEGLCYVGLSRVRELEDLCLTGWSNAVVKAPAGVTELL